jgi:hypothetical protein
LNKEYYKNMKNKESQLSKIYLTKSRFVMGQRCPKALFFSNFQPERASEESTLDRKVKIEGMLVGEYARTYFPEGELIETLKISDAVERTREAIERGVLTIFEAAFEAGGVVIRSDILTRSSVDSPWRLYEVKGNTYHKKDEYEKMEYRNDVAVQAWVLKQAGIDLDGVFLMHLNRECVYPDLSNLFVSEDYTEEIKPILETMDDDVAKLLKILGDQVKSVVAIGPQCENPRICPFKEHCWRHLPKYNVFKIPRCHKKWNFYNDGRCDVDDLNKREFSSPRQARVLKCYQEERQFLDKELARQLLSSWTFPISYFDLEAVSYPIPRYEKTRPYQDLPFQFSLHIQRKPEGDLEHLEFLYDGVDDPREAFIQNMLEALPSDGVIVVYHQSYELTKFKDLKRDFPAYGDRLDDIIRRVVDLKKVIEETVFDPEFLGSFSIKRVAPVLLGAQASYKGLSVSDGIEAMLSFQKSLEFNQGHPEREKIRSGLLEYCKQDTVLMVDLHNWLKKQIEERV